MTRNPDTTSTEPPEPIEEMTTTAPDITYSEATSSILING